MNADERWFKAIEDLVYRIDRVAESVSNLKEARPINKYMRLHLDESLTALTQAQIQLQYTDLARKNR